MSGILEAIDSALDDYATSADAMRWAPEASRVICNGGATMGIGPRRPRLGSADYSPSRDCMEVWAGFGEGFAAGMRRAQESARKCGAQLARLADAGVSAADLPAISAGILAVAAQVPADTSATQVFGPTTAS